jgi:hypothetical protein
MDSSDIATPRYYQLGLAMPLPIRIFLGSAGALCCILLVKEFSPALWPPSILTLFFGFIALGGLSVGLIFVLSAVFGPDEIWTIEPERIAIRRELRGHVELFNYSPSDFTSITIEADTGNDGPDTYFITGELKQGLNLPSFHSRDFGSNLAYRAVKLLSRPLFPKKHYREHVASHKLKSPHNRSRTFVEDALSAFLNK